MLIDNFYLEIRGLPNSVNLPGLVLRSDFGLPIISKEFLIFSEVGLLE